MKNLIRGIAVLLTAVFLCFNCLLYTSQLVRASAQAEAVKRIQPMLDEDEQTVLRHGRNAKPKSVPKSASVAEYAYATALEALFGWLYLKGRYERINELFDICV